MFAIAAEQSGLLSQFLPSLDRVEAGHAGVAETTQTKRRILILEENAALAKLLATGLAAEKLLVETAHCVESALLRLANHSYDMVVLGLNENNPDHMSRFQELRALASTARVLVLGTSGVAGLVSALDNGADDYLMKPFSLVELMARVRALLRRGAEPRPAQSRPDKLVLHRDQCRVERDGRSIDLTPREFALLEVLMKNAGKTLSRAMLTQEVWNMSAEANTNIVDVYIKYLRDKIDGEHEEKLIRTVRGMGYVMQAA